MEHQPIATSAVFSNLRTEKAQGAIDRTKGRGWKRTVRRSTSSDYASGFPDDRK